MTERKTKRFIVTSTRCFFNYALKPLKQETFNVIYFASFLINRAMWHEKVEEKKNYEKND
jgi:hypothetical protein